MSSIKRYDLMGDRASMALDGLGDWVDYDDHAAAMAAKDAEIETLKKDLQRNSDLACEAAYDTFGMSFEIIDLKAKVTSLEQALNSAQKLSDYGKEQGS